MFKINIMHSYYLFELNNNVFNIRIFCGGKYILINITNALGNIDHILPSPSFTKQELAKIWLTNFILKN